jgi:hypothetical protein
MKYCIHIVGDGTLYHFIFFYISYLYIHILKYLKNAEECLKIHVIVSFIHVFGTYPIMYLQCTYHVIFSHM